MKSVSVRTVLAWLDEHIILILTGFLIAFIPLYPKLPLFDAIPGYIVRVRLEDILLLVTGLIWLVQVVLGLVMPAVVLGDELRLRELFLNLVDNAVKYSRPGGSVDISLVTQSGQAKFVIVDHGIGISREDQKRIFDRFYRTDDARTHTKKGTGLGLAICAWIVESHHGRIEVQSEPNKGSTFSVILPLAASS